MLPELSERDQYLNKEYQQLNALRELYITERNSLSRAGKGRSKNQSDRLRRICKIEIPEVVQKLAQLQIEMANLYS